VRRVLSVGAVFGREFDVALVAATVNLDPVVVDQAVGEAQGAAVVQATSDGRYRFAHAIVQSTLLASHEGPRLRRLHLRAAQALEDAASAEPPVAAIAHHLLSALPAGDRASAVRWAWRAGDAAAAHLADDQAIAHYTRAIDASRDAEHDTLVLPLAEAARLHLALGTAHLRTGRVDRARPACAEAARLATDASDAVLVARAALAFGGGADVSIGFEFAGRDDELLALLDTARAVLPPDELALRAVVAGRLAGARYDAGELEVADRLTAEAVALARQSDDTAALAYALAARHAAVWRADSLVERLAIAHELSNLDARAGTPLALQGYVWRVADVLEVGDFDSADVQVSTFDAGLVEGAHARFHWYSKLYHAMRALLRGDLDAFTRDSEQARALGIRAGAFNVGTSYAVQSFFGVRERGELAGLASVLESFADAQPEQVAWRVGAVVARAESGDDGAGARAALQALAADDFAALADNGLWLSNAALLADACASLGAREEAATLYRLLLPYRDRIVVVARIVACIGSAELALGRLATVLGDDAAAEEHLRAARARHVELDAPLLVARTDLAEVERRCAAGDVEGARTLATALGGVATTHGWADVADRARVFAQAG
jgi:tetratricopeptide (TPR) repeat protein